MLSTVNEIFFFAITVKPGGDLTEMWPDLVFICVWSST